MTSSRDPMKPHPWWWDEILEHAATMDDYPASLKQRLPDAIAFLRQELGEIDGRPDLAEDLRLWRVQMNQAAWTRHWLVWLADTLRCLSVRPSYAALQRRLRSPRGFAEATDVVEVAELCDTAGLGVQFEPEVVARGQNRKPDLLVTAPKHADAVFVEVTTLHDPKGLREANRAMNQVHYALANSLPLLHAGRCDRVPKPEELPTISGGLAHAAQRARESGRLEVFSIPGLLLAGLAPEDASESLAVWAESNGLKPLQFSGPDVDTREPWRVVNALREKARQLPEDQTGVVLINNQRVRPDGPFGSDDLGDRTEVMNVLRSLPHVFCLVLCAANWSVVTPPGDGRHRPPWSRTAMRQPHELWKFDYEFLLNPAFNRRKPTSVIAHLSREFSRRHQFWAQRRSAAPT